MNISNITVLIRGGGDIASGVAWRLHQCGFKVIITEIEKPTAVRRKVSFCEAVYDKEVLVESVRGTLIQGPEDASEAWTNGDIPLLVDPQCESMPTIKPDVIVDAILAKKNLGTSKDDAPLVIALGPGFQVGKNADYVVETNRGHNLGRLLLEGAAEPNTGVPGTIQGYATERVLRAPNDGIWESNMNIGGMVKSEDQLGTVSGAPVKAQIDGVIRGLIRPGIAVTKGLKIGDIDPRGIRENCFTLSEKALAIGGSVLEGILRYCKTLNPLTLK